MNSTIRQTKQVMRWSQASEEILGTGERKPTLLFNGYGEQVAGLYKGLDKEALWM